MKTKNNGFTLIELLIAIALASMLMFSLANLMNGVINYLRGINNIVHINKIASFAMRQIDRDFSSLCIVTTTSTNKIEDSPKQLQNINEQNSTNTTTQEQLQSTMPKNQPTSIDPKKLSTIKNTPTFFASINEQQDSITLFGKKLPLMQEVSFISTNALTVYDEKNICPVRITYELVKNKAKTTSHVINYCLKRKECTTLFYKKKINHHEQNNTMVKTYTIADNIKHCAIEYITNNQQPTPYKLSADITIETISTSYIWENKDTNTNNPLIPNFVTIYLELWDDNYKNSFTFSTTIPILCQHIFDTEKNTPSKNEPSINSLKTKDNKYDNNNNMPLTN